MSNQELTDQSDKSLQIFGKKIVQAIAGVNEMTRSMTISQLEKEVQPDFTEYQLKRAFWEHYSDSYKSGSVMDYNIVCLNAKCSMRFLTDRLKKPYFVWWLMQPTPNYMEQSEVLLTKMLQKEFEMLNLPVMETVVVKDKDGNVHSFEQVNTKLLDIQMKYMKDLKDRMVGSVQKTQKSVVQIEKTSNKQDFRDITPDNIDEEIRKLEEDVSHGA
jgi:hypothetical protein